MLARAPVQNNALSFSIASRQPGPQTDHDVFLRRRPHDIEPAVPTTKSISTPQARAQGIMVMHIDVVAYALVVTVSTDMSESQSALALRFRRSCLLGDTRLTCSEDRVTSCSHSLRHGLERYIKNKVTLSLNHMNPGTPPRSCSIVQRLSIHVPDPKDLRHASAECAHHTRRLHRHLPTDRAR